MTKQFGEAALLDLSALRDGQAMEYVQTRNVSWYWVLYDV
jgi:hypothetical protein